MTKEEFHNEKMYQATMGVVRRMHSEGLISQEEYARVEQVFLEKYKPLIGSIYAEIRGNGVDSLPKLRDIW